MAWAAVLGLVVGAGVVLAQVERAAPNVEPSAKERNIRKLMELTGAANLGKQMMDQIIAAFKQQRPGVADQYWDEFAVRFDASEMVDLVVPIYDKHLTHDDIKHLIAFFESPVGRKLTRVQPQIMQESMAAGQRWGQKIGAQIAKDLAERRSL